MAQTSMRQISLVSDIELAAVGSQITTNELEKSNSNTQHKILARGQSLLCGIIISFAIVLCWVLLSRSGQVPETIPEERQHPNISNASFNHSSCPVDQDGTTLRFRIIVLNLDRRSDRLKRFIDNFQSGPAAPFFPCLCRFPAIDGSNHQELQGLVERGFVSNSLVREAEKGAATGGDAKVTPGALGCYASHWAAMRLIAEDDTIDFGLVAEDDLALYSPAFWSEASKLWMDSNGDATRLWQRAGFIYMANSGDPSIWPLSPENAKTTQLIDAGWPKGMALYAISRKAAQKLAGSDSKNGCLMPMWTQIDSYIPGSCPMFNYLRFNPGLAKQIGMYQEGGDTDVQIVGGKRIHRSDESITNQIPQCGSPFKKVNSRRLGRTARFLMWD